jgi:hypothetical protein
VPSSNTGQNLNSAFSASWSETLNPKSFKYLLRKIVLDEYLKKEKTLEVRTSSILSTLEESLPRNSAKYIKTPPNGMEYE